MTVFNVTYIVTILLVALTFSIEHQIGVFSGLNTSVIVSTYIVLIIWISLTGKEFVTLLDLEFSRILFYPCVSIVLLFASWGNNKSVKR